MCLCTVQCFVVLKCGKNGMSAIYMATMVGHLQELSVIHNVAMNIIEGEIAMTGSGRF